MIDSPDIGTGALLFVAGLFAGALSAVAGGASFFTFPALLSSGLPPLVANATNFVALVPSNFAALPAFRPELRLLGPRLLPPIAVGAVGGVLGALALLHLGGDLFASAVPYLMGGATLLFAVAPSVRRWSERHRPAAGEGATPAGLALLFVFSIYGGYFGAGLGQIVLAVMILNGYSDYHLTNALKNAVVAAVSLLSVVLYALSGAVSWPHALIMMAGATAGGYLGGSLSKLVPQRALRVGVIVFGTLLTGYYFWSAS